MKKSLLFILVGGALGVLAPILVSLGNPANMGICAACFLRDTSGALGLHSVGALSYIRPEILGLVLGGFLSSVFWARDFRATGTSNGALMFVLGIFAMIGSLVFLGCPWRMMLRLGGGDMSAIAGLLGLVAGVGVGYSSKRLGFKLEDEREASPASWFVGVLFVLFLAGLYFAFDSDSSKVKHAPFLASLVFAAVLGALVQRSKFCTTGAIAGVFRGDMSMFLGVVSAIFFASVTNAALGQYSFGFAPQPVAHNEWMYNFAGMALAGLCFSLASGCPGKHLTLFGAGRADSAIFVFGMLFGAALAHNLSTAASPKGAGVNSALALGIGFAFCMVVIVLGLRKARA